MLLLHILNFSDSNEMMIKDNGNNDNNDNNVNLLIK